MKEEISAVPNIMGLSEVERHMLQLLAEGLSNEEIAERLSINLRSADYMRKSMIKKTKTKNIPSLVAFGFKYGLLKI